MDEAVEAMLRIYEVEVNISFKPHRKIVKNEPIKCFNRLMTYDWQQPDLPQFQYDLKDIEDLRLCFVEKAA